jgi:predicted N-acetyltransferase YhbS
VQQRIGLFFKKQEMITTRVADPSSESDIRAIVDVTNDAFMADAFFKKAEYHLRFTLDRVRSQISENDSIFIVAECDHEVVGSIFMHICIDTSVESAYSGKDFIVVDTIGKFSAVSVPKKWEKRGIGKKLVSAAERHALDRGLSYLELSKRANPEGLYKLSVDMEMGVINLRKDLFPW